MEKHLHRSVLGIATVATLLCGIVSPSAAAPITFKFDAEITSTSAGGPFNLPLTYEVGDTIYGRFTFDPAVPTTVYDNGISAVQPFEFVFSINGQVVESSPYKFDLQDNSAIEDTDLGTIDLMILHSLPGADSPHLISLPGGDPFRVGVWLMLVGDPSAISANLIPTDAAVWNSFLTVRQLALNFNGPSGAMGFDADVGNFSVVPEPSSVYSAVLTWVALCFRSAINFPRKNNGK